MNLLILWLYMSCAVLGLALGCWLHHLLTTAAPKPNAFTNAFNALALANALALTNVTNALALTH